MSTNNTADNIVTDMRHNDYVGSDASMGRIPGAEQATTGHHFVEVFPKGLNSFVVVMKTCILKHTIVLEGEQKRYTDGLRRPDEHVPPPTGRDLPPRALNQPLTASGKFQSLRVQWVMLDKTLLR